MVHWETQQPRWILQVSVCMHACLFHAQAILAGSKDRYNTILSHFGIATRNVISQRITWIKAAIVKLKTRFCGFASFQVLSAFLWDAEKMPLSEEIGKQWKNIRRSEV